MAEDQWFQAKLKAFDHAAGWGRLVTTVAAGIIALSATFLRDMVRPDGAVALWLIFVAWGLLFLAVVFGTLLVGTMSQYLFKTRPDRLNIRDKEFMCYAYVVQFCFWLGLPALGVFVGLNLSCP